MTGDERLSSIAEGPAPALRSKVALLSAGNFASPDYPLPAYLSRLRDQISFSLSLSYVMYLVGQKTNGGLSLLLLSVRFVDSEAGNSTSLERICL